MPTSGYAHNLGALALGRSKGMGYGDDIINTLLLRGYGDIEIASDDLSYPLSLMKI
jgi:hypothetical protein